LHTLVHYKTYIYISTLKYILALYIIQILVLIVFVYFVELLHGIRKLSAKKSGKTQGSVSTSTTGTGRFIQYIYLHTLVHYKTYIYISTLKYILALYIIQITLIFI
jgi:hypothetical protein